MDVYETGRRTLEIGALEAHDMTSEAALTKLMWILGMTEDIAERDSLTEVTQNASKLIVVDAPNVPQKGDFYSPAR